jgi:S-adenosylmethionine:tRNA ribosyltransferase-isomerase
MRTEDFDYDLPRELIAQDPIEPRDSSRLLVLDKTTGRKEHLTFRDLPGLLRPDDCLIINRTKVMPARLQGAKAATGGAVEILLISPLPDGTWEALVKPSSRVAEGAEVAFGSPLLKAFVLGRLPGGRRVVRFECDGDFRKALERVGIVPLPPYIVKPLVDKRRYQTVYASSDGSVAAPTAGLHFTPELLRKIKAGGTLIGEVDLTVGPGTFQPVKTTAVADHVMHSERFEMPEQTARLVNRTKEQGGRVIAVGTTSARVLETMASADGKVGQGAGATDIFIYPGYDFKVIDALITNFHLPESTLLMLVSALAGRGLIMDTYSEAVRLRYRFFSFGDAMFIK